jgi:uncharacterized 2Fe-2S/4Fe-4S cluster protein (DUF4445 family)
MALISKEKCLEAQRIAGALGYVELAADPSFQKEFVGSLYIPHNTSHVNTAQESVRIGVSRSVANINGLQKSKLEGQCSGNRSVS